MPDPDLATLSRRYTTRRLARGEITRETAVQTASRLLSFAASTPVPPVKVTRRHVEAWMERPGLSGHYRRGRISTLRGFLRWCVLEGHMPKDPSLGIPLPRLPSLLPRALQLSEARAVVAAASNQRDRLIVLLMLQEGLRRIEVAQLERGDIDHRQHLIAVRGKGGGGQVTSRLPVTCETWQAILEYLAVSRGTTGPMIRSTRYPDQGVSPAWVGELVARVMHQAGAKRSAGDGRSGHALRHTCAQDLVDGGVDIRVVQRILRHVSIVTTQTYVRGEVNGLRQAIDGRSYVTSSASAGVSVIR